MQLGDLKAAADAYQRAVEITNPLISVELQDVPALYPAADSTRAWETFPRSKLDRPGVPSRLLLMERSPGTPTKKA